MPNPYPAEFWTASRDQRSLVVRLGGYVNFTDPANQPGGGTLTVTDGVHTVTDVGELDFTSGATVTDGGGGVAEAAISGGGGISLASFPFAFNTAGLNAGLGTGIHSVSGQALIFAAVEVDTVWNGTTPLCDFGVGVSSGGMGIFGSIFNSQIGLDTPDASGAGIVQSQTFQSGIWNASGEIQIWANQTGLKGGASTGASQGSAILWVLQTT